MLTSGGEPLQLTNDEGDKNMPNFSSDGKEVYYERTLPRLEVWTVPALGGAPRRVVSGGFPVASPDGAFIYYVKSDSTGIFRSGKSGLNEELVYNAEGTGLDFLPLLLFPGGNDLLAVGVNSQPKVHFLRVNVWLANCYFAYNSLRFPALLPFFNASSLRPFHPPTASRII